LSLNKLRVATGAVLIVVGISMLIVNLTPLTVVPLSAMPNWWQQDREIQWEKWEQLIREYAKIRAQREAKYKDAVWLPVGEAPADFYPDGDCPMWVQRSPAYEHRGSNITTGQKGGWYLRDGWTWVIVSEPGEGGTFGPEKVAWKCVKASRTSSDTVRITESSYVEDTDNDGSINDESDVITDDDVDKQEQQDLLDNTLTISELSLIVHSDEFLWIAIALTTAGALILVFSRKS